MKSLYEQDPTNWDILAKSGKPNLREVAKHFSRFSDMDQALGVVGAAAHWHAGRNGAWRTTDRRAADWLKENAGKRQLSEGVVKSGQSQMLLIVATSEQATKIKKVAALIGAEVTDV